MVPKRRKTCDIEINYLDLQNNTNEKKLSTCIIINHLKINKKNNQKVKIIHTMFGTYFLEYEDIWNTMAN